MHAFASGSWADWHGNLPLLPSECLSLCSNAAAGPLRVIKRGYSAEAPSFA